MLPPAPSIPSDPIPAFDHNGDLLYHHDLHRDHSTPCPDDSPAFSRESLPLHPPLAPVFNHRDFLAVTRTDSSASLFSSSSSDDSAAAPASGLPARRKDTQHTAIFLARSLWKVSPTRHSLVPPPLLSISFVFPSTPSATRNTAHPRVAQPPRHHLQNSDPITPISPQWLDPPPFTHPHPSTIYI